MIRIFGTAFAPQILSHAEVPFYELYDSEIPDSRENTNKRPQLQKKWLSTESDSSLTESSSIDSGTNNSKSQNIQNIRFRFNIGINGRRKKRVAKSKQKAKNKVVVSVRSLAVGKLAMKDASTSVASIPPPRFSSGVVNMNVHRPFIARGGRQT